MLLSSGDNLNLIRFNLLENIKHILINLDNEITRKNIEVNINSEDKDLYIEADSVLMQQAIFNIIHNAVRYSNENAAVDITVTKNRLSVKKSLALGANTLVMGIVNITPDSFSSISACGGKDIC